MKLSQNTHVLKETLSEILSGLAFLFEDDEPADVDPGQVWLATDIGYTGPFRGNLTFWCTRDFGRILAANLLGVGPDDPDADRRVDDAVKELMNIVCGNLVTALHGTEHVFDLTIPRIVELPQTPPIDEQPDDENVASLSYDGCRIMLMHKPAA